MHVYDICMCVYVYVCMYVYIYIYIHIHTYIHIHVLMHQGREPAPGFLDNMSAASDCCQKGSEEFRHLKTYAC